MEITFFVIVGIAIVLYLNKGSRDADYKEASREASYMNVAAIDLEVENILAEWKRFGVLNDKKKVFLDVLFSRRIDLVREAESSNSDS